MYPLKSPLLRLPLEVRLEIYHYSLSPRVDLICEKPYDHYFGWINNRFTLIPRLKVSSTALLATSRIISAEVHSFLGNQRKSLLDIVHASIRHEENSPSPSIIQSPTEAFLKIFERACFVFQIDVWFTRRWLLTMPITVRSRIRKMVFTSGFLVRPSSVSYGHEWRRVRPSSSDRYSKFTSYLRSNHNLLEEVELYLPSEATGMRQYDILHAAEELCEMLEERRLQTVRFFLPWEIDDNVEDLANCSQVHRIFVTPERPLLETESFREDRDQRRKVIAALSEVFMVTKEELKSKRALDETREKQNAYESVIVLRRNPQLPQDYEPRLAASRLSTIDARQMSRRGEITAFGILES